MILIRQILAILSLVAVNIFAHCAPIPAEKLFQNPQVGVMDFSPNGELISLLLNDEDGKFLTLIDIDTNVAHPIYKFLDGQTLVKYQWLNNKNILMTTQARGDESKVVLSINITENRISATSKFVFSEGYLVSSLPDDPDSILYAKFNESDNSTQLFKLPVSEVTLSKFDKKYQIKGLREEDVIYVYLDHSKRLVKLHFEEETDKIIFSFKRLSQAEFRPFLEIGIDGLDFEIQDFISDTKLAVISNRDSDKKALYEYDVATKSFGKLLYEHAMYDLVSATISAETNSVESVAYFDHGQLATVYFDDENKKESQMIKAAFPSEQFAIIANNKASQQKIIKTFASHRPSVYYLYNESKKTASMLYPKYPNLDDYTFSKSEPVKVHSPDGKLVEAFLSRPNELDLKTLVVMPHGGPIGIREYDTFNSTVQYFTSRGFSVLRINFRGSTGYGKEFEKQGVGQWGKLIEEDITHVVNVVTAKYSFDYTCSIGASYGGYSSFMLAIKYPDKYDCIVGAYGAYDLPLMFNSSNYAVQEEERSAWAGTIGEFDLSLFEVSPVYLAKNLQTPALLIGGKKDPVTSFEHTNRMFYILGKMNKPVQGVFYKNVGHGHGTWWGEWHEHALTYQFLLKTLNLPQIDPENIKIQDRELIAKEYSRIAWAYANDETVDKDVSQAVEFFHLASEFGDREAFFNAGWYYEYDDVVPNDIEKAYRLYKKSSELGYARASISLGNIYYDGKNVSTDYNKAFEYYSASRKQGFHAGINMLLARSHCLGRGTQKNVTYCAELLQLDKYIGDKQLLNKVNQQSFQFRKNIIPDIILDGNYSDEEFSEIHDVIKKEYRIDIFPVEIDEQEFGEVNSGRKRFIYSNTLTIENESDTKIGVSFDAGRGNLFSDKLVRTAIIGVWTTELTDGTKKDVNRSFVYGNETADWSMHYTLGNADRDATSLTLTLVDLNNKPIYSKRFQLTNSASIH